jgi:hypothetical protein
LERRFPGRQAINWWVAALWDYGSFADMTVYNRAQEAVSSTLNEETGEVEAPDSLNLIDQYVALLMATFIDAGLLDVSPFDANGILLISIRPWSRL